MKTEIITVTPKRAEEYLSANTINRTLRKSVVERYANDMKMGRWELTHQGIAVANDGTLLDGQHRLHAVIKAGVPVMMQVTTGLDVSAFANIDKLVARTDADSLRIDRRIVECAKLLLSLTGSKTLKPSLQDLRRVCEIIEPLYNKHLAGKNVRTYSAVPIRSAVIMAMLLQPHRQNEIGYQYAALISQDYDSMTAGTRLLSKALNTGQVTSITGHTARIALFCRALPVFDGQRDENVRLVPASIDYCADCIDIVFGGITGKGAKC
mgnify:CR=1 FL=1